MGKEWDSFKETGSSKHFHSPDTETARGFGGFTGGTPIKALPRYNSAMKEYQAWCKVWARALFRAMRSGGHILVFGGTRTVHRLTCALEDAGFEIRDMLSWVYGSGFPKGLNVSKAIDKKFGLEQPVVGRQKTARPIAQGDYERVGKIPMATKEKDGSMSNPEQQGVITQPVSPEAQYWQGWNTVLKPAHEPIMLARKPISESSVIEHVLTHGIGAINIGECRVAVNPDVDDMRREVIRNVRESPTWRNGSGFKNEGMGHVGIPLSGRYPANLILSHHPDCKLVREGKTSVKDVSTHSPSTKLGKYGIYGDFVVPVNMRHSFDVVESEIWECVPDCPVKMLNEQSGDTKYAVADKLDPVDSNTPILGSKGIYGLFEAPRIVQRYGGSGGAARFFYCPKPSTKERALGLDVLGLEHNPHVTVKPIKLVRYLVRLITPFGGVVADPFLGAGTTAIAAEMEGFQWVGCDNNKDYCDIARARIGAARKQARAEK